MFDEKEDDSFNFGILMKSIYFDCHILKIALIGECKRFVSSNIVQKVLNEIWFNAYLFLEYHDMKIVYYDFNFFQVNK